MSAVLFGGSRRFQAAGLVSFVLRSFFSLPGARASVGCAVGADALILGAALAVAPGQVSVFAAFDPSGAGSWSGSAVGLVRRAAALGVPVSWLAGGDLCLPLVARLLRRSLAAARPCSQAVFFLDGDLSRSGSLAVARRLLPDCVAVFAFARSAPPALSPDGCWVPAAFAGVSSAAGFSCFAWVPGASSFQPALFS